MFENTIKEIARMIASEVDKKVRARDERCIGAFQEMMREEIAKAYRKGYLEATEDACRRLEKLYAIAYAAGNADGYADAGAVNIEEVADDISEALGEETA